MKGALDSSARLLFRSALVIFLVTIVIGILNGLDIRLPDRQMILTRTRWNPRLDHQGGRRRGNTHVRGYCVP